MTIPLPSDDGSRELIQPTIPADFNAVEKTNNAETQRQDLVEAIMLTMPTPFLVLDESLTVRLANDAFYHHFRISPGETKDQLLWQLGNGQWDIPIFRRLLMDVLPRNASVVNFEISNDFPEVGTRVLLLNASTVFPRHGKASYILLAIQDVTSQREHEQQLKELNKRLQQHNDEVTFAYKELESFSYSVSHDLRAPLRGVAGFSQAVLEDYGDQLDATGHDYLQRIRNGTIRMAQLIDDILQLSRLSRIKLQMTDFDLRNQVEVILNDLRRSDPTRNVQVRLPEAAPATGDKHLIVIALTNLLSNAWKFTAKTARPFIEFGIQQDNGQAVYYVRDNGIGLEPKYAEQIFQPFNRLHSTADFPGSGIGLAIVHRVIRRHRGQVWVTSAPNEGATFYFTLTNKPVQQHE